MFLNKVIDSRGVDYIVGLFKGSLSVPAKQWKDVLVIKLLLGDWLLDTVDWSHQGLNLRQNKKCLPLSIIGEARYYRVSLNDVMLTTLYCTWLDFEYWAGVMNFIAVERGGKSLILKLPCNFWRPRVFQMDFVTLHSA